MNMFVSGPLMFRELIQAITRKTFVGQAGLLHGYAQFMIKDEGQSAMIPFPDRTVDGVVYRDVDEDSLARIDAFQGNRFEREEVTVEGEDGAWVEASAYCLKLRRRKLLSTQAWDEDDYRESTLKKDIAACRK
jgi:gamma-glutamylcyclotransferase (GGCT)/AIG2-like uncharacterized protein YtfP